MKIKFHYTLLLFVCLGIICGILKDILIIYSLIMLHELGHLVFIRLFRREVKEITILPLGGIIDYHNDENKPLYEDFLINGGGVFVNIILLIIFRKGLFHEYNLMILAFNILPIYPLDGGRILEVFLAKIFKFRIAIIILSSISILLICVVFIYNFLTLKAISVYLVFIFLLLENVRLFKERRKKYQMFLIKKYLFPNEKLNNRRIRNPKNIINDFYKGVNNVLKEENKCISEQTILEKYFKR